MAYYSKIALIFVLVTIFYVPCLEGRKVLNMAIMKGSLMVHNLVPSILHNIPTSTPSLSAHSNRKLVTMHNVAIDRFLYSVPSPGIGNFN
ncbi:hypothetical protein ACOSP7_031047 [Xanthoceras sorbifolium]